MPNVESLKVEFEKVATDSRIKKKGKRKIDLEKFEEISIIRCKKTINHQPTTYNLQPTT